MSKVKATPSREAEHDALHRDLSTAIIAFHEKGARALGMSAAERKTLGVLWFRQVATAGELAKATGLTTGAITGIVDRLEAAGYARREANPTDRRSVLIRPQREAEIRRRIMPGFSALSDAMTKMRGAFSAAELKAIDRYLARTTQVLKTQTERLGTAGGRRAV